MDKRTKKCFPLFARFVLVLALQTNILKFILYAGFRYDDGQLIDFLLDWIADNSKMGLLKLNIYSQDVEDLLKRFGSNELYFFSRAPYTGK